MKKIMLYFLVVILLFNSVNVYATNYAAEKNTAASNVNTKDNKIDFKLQSKSAVLIDENSGKVLYDNNSHAKLPPASITKVMSLILFMEALDSGKIKTTDKVTISENASDMGGSQVYLATGEEMTVDDLLKAICIASGNDATVAMAEYVAGSEESFVDMMNEKAKAMGLKDTHFSNSTGLPAENHYTSAYDIAMMSRDLIYNHPKILHWTSIYLDKLRNGTFDLANTNKLVRLYKGADGLKTGSTDEAGFCLSATAERNNLRLISVVLGAPDSKTRFSEATKLLDYGFASYENYKVASKGQIIKNVSVEKGLTNSVKAVSSQDLSILLKKGEKNKITYKINLPKAVKAPVKSGQNIGNITVYKDGVNVGKVSLVSDGTIKKAGVFNYYKKLMDNIM